MKFRLILTIIILSIIFTIPSTASGASAQHAVISPRRVVKWRLPLKNVEKRNIPFEKPDFYSDFNKDEIDLLSTESRRNQATEILWHYPIHVFLNETLTDPQKDFILKNSDRVIIKNNYDQYEDFFESDKDVHLFIDLRSHLEDGRFWYHINQNENMFHHSEKVGDPQFRIASNHTPSRYLFDASDWVVPNDSYRHKHWVNYMAENALKALQETGAKGIYIKNAHNTFDDYLWSKKPWDYHPQKWKIATQQALSTIKYVLDDYRVAFNGKLWKSDEYLNFLLVDDGLMSKWILDPEDGTYLGKDNWKNGLELAQKTFEHPEKTLTLVSGYNGLVENYRKRMFVFSSYLLVVQDDSIILRMFNKSKFEYYPEYEIDIGDPLENYIIEDNGLYTRDFDNGRVIVNPQSEETLTYTLGDESWNVVYTGKGGQISPSGGYDGFVGEIPVTEKIIELPGQTGIILTYRNTTGSLGPEKESRTNPHSPTNKGVQE